MILIVSNRKKEASCISEIFHHMSILSFAATPREALSEISSLYRAVLIYEPCAFPDISDYVRRLRTYKSDIPIYAITSNDSNICNKEIFEQIFINSTFTTALAKKIINQKNKYGLGGLGDYRLAGINASANTFGVKYFSYGFDLTKTEAMILRFLIRSYPLPQSADSILKYSFRPSRAPEASSIRTHISSINKKFNNVIERKLISLSQKQGYIILTPEIIFNSQV